LSGIADMVKNISENNIATHEFKSIEKELNSSFRLSSKSEAYYYKIFNEYFPKKSYINLVSRWDPLSQY